MPKNPKRLGRGLSSIVSLVEERPGEDSPPPHHPQPFNALIDIARIRPNPFQPRQDISPEDLKPLAQSIRNAGLIQPIIVRPTEGHAYEIITGERRWRAFEMAGKTQIPAILREATDQEMLELALVENIFREDLNAIERATAYRRYCAEFKLSADDVAKRLGEDRSTVANYLRILELPTEVKTWVAQGKLAMGHARCLLAITSPSDLIRTAKEAISRDLSVRALEKLVRDRVQARRAATKPANGAPDAKRPQISHLEQAFIRELGTKVEISESRRKGAGKIVIHYYSLDDFDRVAERLGISH